jgi:hypothetical protein
MNIVKKSPIPKSRDKTTKVSKKGKERADDPTTVYRPEVPVRDMNEGFPGLKIKLFPHQLESVANMEILEEKRKKIINHMVESGPTVYTDCSTPLFIEFTPHMGVLADIPGYGKSLSMVGLLCRDMMEWDTSETNIHRMNYDLVIEGNLKSMDYMTTAICYETPKLRANLLVCSASLLAQWKEYFAYSNLKVTTITTKKHIENLNANDWDVIIVVPGMYNHLYTKYAKFMWKRFIFDDPTQCNIPNMSPMMAGFTWFISASSLWAPNMNMFHSRHWLHKLFKISEWKYKLIVVKNDDDFVRSSFRIAEPVVYKHQCVNPMAVNAVRQFVGQEVAEMLLAGDVRGAIEKLGGSNTNGNLMDVVLRKHTRDREMLVEDFESAKSISLDTSLNAQYINYYKKRVVDIEAEIKKLDQKIRDMKERFENVLKEPCGICTDTLSKPILQPCCQHIFCGECIMGWYQDHTTCPMCRSEVDMTKLVYVSDIDKNYSTSSRSSPVSSSNELLSRQDTFMKILKSILDENANNKVLLFSSADATFRLLKTYMKTAGVRYAEAKGCASLIEKNLDRYRNGDISVMFLNTNYSGAGINLENTTHIILYHPVESADLYQQIVGRAMRLGRKAETLKVHIIE